MRRPALVLALLLAALALVAAGCGGSEEVTATPETVVGTVPTSGGEEGCTVPACELEGDSGAGKTVFTGSSGCTGCHTLADADANGTAGPNLDQAKPSFERAATWITNGRGGMPAFAGKLSDQQIADVAQYIAEATEG